MCTLTHLLLAFIVLFVPETYHPVLLRNKAIRLREETGNPDWIAPIEKLSRSIAKTVLWSCIRPFQLLIFEPMVGSSSLTGILIGGLMPCSSASTFVFSARYCWEFYTVSKSLFLHIISCDLEWWLPTDRYTRWTLHA
jgi:hypothetical protein